MSGAMIATYVAAATLFVAGVSGLVWGAAIGRANDTKGPEWVRNFRAFARPGRTSPTSVRVMGGLFVAVSIFLVVVALTQ